jgi:hypothetical protein
MEKQCPTCGHRLLGTFQVEDLAKGAYSAYGLSTNNKNFRGEEMPTWEALPLPIQTAWKAAAKSVFDVIT